MKKIFLTIGLWFVATSAMMAQSVYVYRNDGNMYYELYETVNRLSCSKLDADQVEQNRFVMQEIETADTLFRIPLVAIDSISFHSPGYIPASFPRKHLIEEFTGQGCGYCPYGMDCISEFMANDTNFILILHHYGYQADHFSVTGSKTITSALGVNGAPSAAIDRAKTRTQGGNAIVFHPSYLPSASKDQFEQETYASVNIANAYDPETRQLTVTVSGAICKNEHPQLNITVIVKESGMIDTQSDYYNTYEGWQEFRHCNAVRAILTAAKGDALSVDPTRHYSVTYTTTLKEAWVPENCMVVAFLGESFKPVIQVEDEPVIAGTAGGDDIEHGGITRVPVADYYPESDAERGPSDFSGKEVQEMTTSTAYYEVESDRRTWQLQAYNLTSTTKISGTTCIPFAWIQIFTERTATSIPEGRYEFNTSGLPGTALAGYRNDAAFEVGGSEFYFTSKSYFTQGYLVPSAEWLIADGTLTVTADGWTIVGHARNGSDISLKGTGKITNGGAAGAPQRIVRK